MDSIIIYQVLGSFISLIYLVNIIPIIRLRNKIFAPLMYVQSIIFCITLALFASYIGAKAPRIFFNCVTMLWIMFINGSVMGSNYVVKCLRILIQSEWNYYYKSRFKLSDSSNLSSSESFSESDLNKFILKGLPLLKTKNSLTLFLILNLISMILPITLTLSSTEYREHPENDCVMVNTVSTLFSALIILIFLVIIIVSIGIIIKRRKISKNMFVFKHLKHIAIAWVIGIILFIVDFIVAQMFLTNMFMSSLLVFLCFLIFVPAFIAEVIVPQIIHYRTKKHNKDNEELKNKVDSIVDLIGMDFKNEIKIEEGEDRKYVNSVNDCLKFFIMESEIDNKSTLLNKLQFIHSVNKVYKNNSIAPGHIFKLWKLFFSLDESIELNDIKIKIPNNILNKKLRKYFGLNGYDKPKKNTETKSQWIDYLFNNIDEWTYLYKHDNDIGELTEEYIKNMIMMENNIIDDNLDKICEVCKEYILHLYTENIQIIDEIILDNFKESGYFHILTNNK